MSLCFRQGGYQQSCKAQGPEGLHRRLIYPLGIQRRKKQGDRGESGDGLRWGRSWTVPFWQVAGLEGKIHGPPAGRTMRTHRTMAGCLLIALATLPGVRAAEIVFEDIAPQAGLDFVHEHGGSGDKYMVETMGSGACFLPPSCVHRQMILHLSQVGGWLMSEYWRQFLRNAH